MYSSLTLSKNLVQATYSTCSLIYYWFNIKIINSCNEIFLLQKKHNNFVHNLEEPLGYKCIKIWFQEFQQLSMFLKIENILHGHAVSTEQKIPVQSKTIQNVRQCLETPALLLIHYSCWKIKESPRIGYNVTVPKTSSTENCGICLHEMKDAATRV